MAPGRRKKRRTVIMPFWRVVSREKGVRICLFHFLRDVCFCVLRIRKATKETRTVSG